MLDPLATPASPPNRPDRDDDAALQLGLQNREADFVLARLGNVTRRFRPLGEQSPQAIPGWR
jgi:hypothetical protein